MSCQLCGRENSAGFVCPECYWDLIALGATPPDAEASREQVQAWAKANNVTVFRCGKAAIVEDWK